MKGAIFILSTGRPASAAKTAQRFSGAFPVLVVTRQDCAAAYAEALYDTNASLHVLPTAYRHGIAQARDYAIILAHELRYDVIVMSDDDISIAELDSAGKVHALPIDVGGYATAARLLAYSVAGDQYGLSCLRDRLFCNEPYKLQIPTRLVGVNVSLLSTRGIKYAFCEPFTVMEDYHFALKMLSLGIPWLVHTGFVVGDRGTNAKGGCSEFRTPELQTRCALRLASEFPDWVRTYQKNGPMGTYLDVKFFRTKIAKQLAEASCMKKSSSE